LLVVSASAVCLAATLVPAAAAPSATASVSRVAATGATHTSLTFTVSGAASRYRVYVAQVHHQLIAADLPHDASSGWSTSKTLTVSGLKYSTDPFFFRVVAESGTRHAYSNTFGPVGLKPSVPSGLAANRATDGALSLTWGSVAGSGYVVTRASDSAMTQGVESYQLKGPDAQFTPPELTKGASYYFTVRAVNDTTRSGPSAAVAGTSAASDQQITTMTYNLREATLDKQPDGKNYGAPWDERKGSAAALIRTATPDVIAIEEGASFVDGSATERQVDSLVTALGSPYELARTEIPPTEKHYYRTGDYIIYNSNVLRADDPTGAYPDHDYWDLGEASLGNQHWAAYQEFTDIASGAKFVFVAFHLVEVNNSPSADNAAREEQTTSMVSQATSFDASLGLPIVYAGDTNSALESSHPVDGPRVVMRAHDIDDAFDVAQTRANTKYNSGNQYFAEPPASSIYIDAVFAEPGVGVTSWNELLNLSGGKFVDPIPSDHNPVVVSVDVPF
jgi:hypothetical protein